MSQVSTPDTSMKVLGGKRCRTVIVLTVVVFACGVVYFGYFCPDQVCALTAGPPTPQYKTPFEAYLKGELPHQDFAESQLDRDYDFDIEGEDVIVYLHVQKTGGTTFGRHLVKNIQLARPCVCHRGRKRCDCTNAQRNIWLFSRYSTGWACGLHADWTELKDCVDAVLDKREKTHRSRRYLYISILRDPVMRFLSEWKHVQRGSTWLAAHLRCNGRSASLQEVPFCFTGEDWSNVSLEEFVGCPYNLANNRLTRMLANMSLVGCYNMSAMLPIMRDKIMLQSAKDNLRDLAFFGLTEYQRSTQYLFERTFKLKFINDFTQRNVTHAGGAQLTPKQRKLVLQVNRLDIELYQYAKDLFYQRVAHAREEDARHNITNRLLLPPSEEPPAPVDGASAGSSAQQRRQGPGRRRSPRHRHKYRSEAEVAAAEDWREGRRQTGGLLLPLNQQGQPARRYPLTGPKEAGSEDPPGRDGLDPQGESAAVSAAQRVNADQNALQIASRLQRFAGSSPGNLRFGASSAVQQVHAKEAPAGPTPNGGLPELHGGQPAYTSLNEPHNSRVDLSAHSVVSFQRDESTSQR